MRSSCGWFSHHLKLGALYTADAQLLALVLIGGFWCVHQGPAQGTSESSFLPLFQGHIAGGGGSLW